MQITVTDNFIALLKKKAERYVSVKTVMMLSALLGITATYFSYVHDYIVLYGDAESHLNIAKRVVSSVTPGLTQLGGVWLPLPHLMMTPLVYFDFLWKSGLAGSIISGICFVVSCVFLYKTVFLLTENKTASFVSFLIFAANPNILYLQATPMTELPLICFFILSNYFFIRFIYKPDEIFLLIPTAFFGLCASLSRYDGWFLVLTQALLIIFLQISKRQVWNKMEGLVILYATLAFFGIFLWLLWDLIILGDPFYFKNSIFSAGSQQLVWFGKGQLPAYHNLLTAILYYLVTSASNIGIIFFFLFLISVFSYKNILVTFILFVPFIFYVVTMFFGQSVIYIPHLTPVWYEWRLFNVRYGLMMVAPAAIFVGLFFTNKNLSIKLLFFFLFVIQLGLFLVGYSKVITFADGYEGLSTAKRPDAEYWLAKNYDGGLVVLDDYSRLTSIIRSNIPMDKVIYIGTKPYWEESLKEPEKYARWIIIQRFDDVWKNIYDNEQMQGRLYKYFKKVYTSEEILIFKRNDEISKG